MVGNGAREHAIASALFKSPKKPELYAFMSARNPGIAGISKDIKIANINNGKDVAEYSVRNKIDLAVIGPEAPLEAGVVDELESAGIRTVGPRKIAAQLETDKSFCRNLLKKYNVSGNAKFGIFSDYKDAVDFIDSSDEDVVIKPAGLTGGKGVKIMGEHLKDREDAKKYVKEILEQKIGKIQKVVIEEKLVGEEFTLQAFVDGSHVIGAPMVQDHKRAYDGDCGPNTGGMGSYSDKGYILPFLTQKDYDIGIGIMEDSIKALKKETGIAYKGFLYGQFMTTKKGPVLIEFNSRLGDPEAMNILSILESDFVEICGNIAEGKLKNKAKFKEKATVCKYLVPSGYPENPKTNVEVTVNEKEIERLGGVVYYASVREENGKILTSSSRAICITGIADSIADAERVAENSMKYVKGDLFHRRDIGTKELIQKRIEHMREVRG